MKDIVEFIRQTYTENRIAIGNQTDKEADKLVERLIKGKIEGLSDEALDLLKHYVLTTSAKQEVEGMLSRASSAGGNLGVNWNFIALGGNYQAQNSEGVRLLMQMEYASMGAPDFEKLKSLPVDELKKLQKVLGINDGQQETT